MNAQQEPTASLSRFEIRELYEQSIGEFPLHMSIKQAAQALNDRFGDDSIDRMRDHFWDRAGALYS